MKNGFLKRLLFFGTKLLGNKDAKALGDSLNGPQNQPVYLVAYAEKMTPLFLESFRVGE